MVLAEAFISIFTDNPVGGKNLSPDMLSAEWIRLQPIKSQHTLCQSKTVFSEEYVRKIINRTLKKNWGPIWWDVREKTLAVTNPHWHSFFLMTWKVSLRERLTQGCYNNMWKSCWRRLKCSKPSTFSLQSNSNLGK